MIQVTNEFEWVDKDGYSFLVVQDEEGEFLTLPAEQKPELLSEGKIFVFERGLLQDRPLTDRFLSWRSGERTVATG